jgi:hypothetical protein
MRRTIAQAFDAFHDLVGNGFDASSRGAFRHAAARGDRSEEPALLNLTQASVFLRRAPIVDALVSAVLGALMALGATVFQVLRGLPSALLMPTVLVFAALQFIGLRRACAIVAA